MVERSGGDDVPASTTRRTTLCSGLELTCNTKTQSLNIGHAIPVGITKMMQPFLSFSTLSTGFSISISVAVELVQELLVGILNWKEWKSRLQQPVGTRTIADALILHA